MASTIDDAVSAGPLVVACLLDHASVHEVLDPVARRLTGRSLINLTTTTPNQARELAAWADRHAVRYLDGGIMAVPDMIGGPGSAILYSGSDAVFAGHEAMLGVWGESSYLGPDAGMASLYDLAMLSGMRSGHRWSRTCGPAGPPLPHAAYRARGGGRLQKTLIRA